MASITLEGPAIPPAEGRASVILANIPDAAQMLGMQALCQAYGYQATITNPAYNPSDPESPQTIANPMGPGEFAARQIMRFVDEQAVSQFGEARANAAKKEALEEIKSLRTYDVEFK